MATHETVDPGTLWLVIGLASGIIGILLIVVGFFLKVLHTDVRKNTVENGKNKGRIDLVAEKQKQDKEHLEEMTQLQIQGLTTEVKTLSGNVNDMTTEIRNLVVNLAGEGIKVKGNG